MIRTILFCGIGLIALGLIVGVVGVVQVRKKRKSTSLWIFAVICYVLGLVFTVGSGMNASRNHEASGTVKTGKVVHRSGGTASTGSDKEKKVSTNSGNQQSSKDEESKETKSTKDSRTAGTDKKSSAASSEKSKSADGHSNSTSKIDTKSKSDKSDSKNKKSDSSSSESSDNPKTNSQKSPAENLADYQAAIYDLDNQYGSISSVTPSGVTVTIRSKYAHSSKLSAAESYATTGIQALAAKYGYHPAVSFNFGG